MNVPNYDLHSLKPLNSQQYDRAKQQALERIQQRSGDKPTRAQFQRELGPLWTILDLLALVIFIAALAISSLHILEYAGAAATEAYASGTGGVDATLYSSVHKLGFILLAEAAMLLFFVMYRMHSGFEKWLSAGLAILAVAFVVTANLSSGLNVFLAALAPAFTIGIGFRLEALIAASLERRADVTERYTAALESWETATKDAEKHPDFPAVFAREIWDYLTKLKANAEFIDAPPDMKREAVQREMRRDTWAYEMNDKAVSHAMLAPVLERPAGPLVEAATNGNGRH